MNSNLKDQLQALDSPLLEKASIEAFFSVKTQ